VSRTIYRWGLGVTEFPWLQDPIIQPVIDLHARCPVTNYDKDGEMQEKKFIIWDPRDEDPPGRGPRRDEEGNITSDGLIGRVGEGNVYLATYADYTGAKFAGDPDRIRRHTDLGVGECTGAYFSLSGSKGWYQVWRVQ